MQFAAGAPEQALHNRVMSINCTRTCVACQQIAACGRRHADVTLRRVIPVKLPFEQRSTRTVRTDRTAQQSNKAVFANAHGASQVKANRQSSSTPCLHCFALSPYDVDIWTFACTHASIVSLQQCIEHYNLRVPLHKIGPLHSLDSVLLALCRSVSPLSLQTRRTARLLQHSKLPRNRPHSKASSQKPKLH